MIFVKKINKIITVRRRRINLVGGFANRILPSVTSIDLSSQHLSTYINPNHFEYSLNYSSPLDEGADYREE